MPLPSRVLEPATRQSEAPPLAKIAMTLFMALVCAVATVGIAGAIWVVAFLLTHLPH